LPSPKAHRKNSSQFSSRREGVDFLNKSGIRSISGRRVQDSNVSRSSIESPNKNELKGFLESKIKLDKRKRRDVPKQTYQIDTVRLIHPHEPEKVSENNKSISSIRSNLEDNHPTFRKKAGTELFNYHDNPNIVSPPTSKHVLNPSTRAEIITRNNEYKDEEDEED
jgi:hypothetical protein